MTIEALARGQHPKPEREPKHRRRYGLRARWRDGENGYVGRHRRLSLGESLAVRFRQALSTAGGVR